MGTVPGTTVLRFSEVSNAMPARAGGLGPEDLRTDVQERSKRYKQEWKDRWGARTQEELRPHTSVRMGWEPSADQLTTSGLLERFRAGAADTGDSDNAYKAQLLRRHAMLQEQLGLVKETLQPPAIPQGKPPGIKLPSLPHLAHRPKTFTSTALSSNATLMPTFAPWAGGMGATFAPGHPHQKYTALPPLPINDWQPVRRLRNGCFA